MTSNEPTRHEVTSFDDVMLPAQSYKSGFPTIIHLTAEPKESGRRIVDFFSGLAFGTDGTFEKVAEGLYLLTAPVDQVTSMQLEDQAEALTHPNVQG